MNMYNSRLDIAEERIHELDECCKEKKEMEAIKEKLRNMGDKMIRSNIIKSEFQKEKLKRMRWRQSFRK